MDTTVIENSTQFWIGTGWKMNKTLAQSLAYSDLLVQGTTTLDKRIQLFVIPPFTSVRQVKERMANERILVGAQNMHWAEEGAWTGEISPAMLTDCHLDIVELGHSERRLHFAETDAAVALKTEAAIRHNLMPLICIGETLDERDNNQADAVLQRQLTIALGGLSDQQKQSPLLLAYEPFWAIGTKGVPATPEYTDARHKTIRDVAISILGRQVPCLYGGSVSQENCVALMQCPYVDGLFIGRAAWDINSYLEILSMSEATIAERTHK